jgi:hypothetical protein
MQARVNIARLLTGRKQATAEDGIEWVRTLCAEVNVPALRAWTVRGSQAYNEVDAERAWAELLALYKQNLA